MLQIDLKLREPIHGYELLKHPVDLDGHMISKKLAKTSMETRKSQSRLENDRHALGMSIEMSSQRMSGGWSNNDLEFCKKRLVKTNFFCRRRWLPV